MKTTCNMTRTEHTMQAAKLRVQQSQIEQLRKDVAAARKLWSIQLLSRLDKDTATAVTAALQQHLPPNSVARHDLQFAADLLQRKTGPKPEVAK